jgi:hypothetical protein
MVPQQLDLRIVEERGGGRVEPRWVDLDTMAFEAALNSNGRPVFPMGRWMRSATERAGAG